jgi:Fe-S cluster assembly ATP-binding protein
VLALTNVTVVKDEKVLVQNFTLSCHAGTTHIIMGPNGSGKTSLALALIGHPNYKISHGSLFFNGQDLLPLTLDKRASAGMFLAFQHPYEIPGVPIITFLQEAYRALGGTESSVIFKELLAEALIAVGLDKNSMYRAVNQGFSGGEKKRLELAQVLLLNPQVIILDEPDSGIDAEGISAIHHVLKIIKNRNPPVIIIVITHNGRLAEMLDPDFVHVMGQTKLLFSGGKSLAVAIDAEGYREFSHL